MQFIRSEGTEKLVQALYAYIATCLEAKLKVVWLVPGGSNIQVATKVMQLLGQKNTENLTCMLTDERFGPKGHKDSNYFQLETSGFDMGASHFTDILESGDLDSVRKKYDQLARTKINEADIVVAFFGMGADGHIAGILPHSPAATAGNIWVESYETNPYTRVTLTPFALSHVDCAFVGAFGAEKQQPLELLHEKTLPVAEQPAQILRYIKEVFIYNDHISSEEKGVES